jgi:hypothetical protein
VFLLNSCSDSTGPDLPDYCAIAYSTLLFTEVPGDSVLLEIGTDYLPVMEEEWEVFLNTRSTDDGNARLDIHVVGGAYDKDLRAVLSHEWRGDTLSVWCGKMALYYATRGEAQEADSPKPTWVAPERVDVSLPPGVGFRYLGRWYRQALSSVI